MEVSRYNTESDLNFRPAASETNALPTRKNVMIIMVADSVNLGNLLTLFQQITCFWSHLALLANNEQKEIKIFKLI